MTTSTDPILRLLLGATCLAVLGGAPAGAATAPTADCAKAVDALDGALCGDPAAKAADEAMAKAYEELRAGLDKPTALQLLANQREWLGNRKANCPGDGETEAACLARWSEARRRALAGDAAEGPGGGGRLVPVIAAKTGAKGHWSTSSFLFRFADPRGPGQLAFNAAVDKAMAGVPSAIDGAGEGRDGTWSQQAGIAYRSPRLVSVRVDGAEFASGAAHGMAWTQNINVDLSAGKVLTAADILRPGMATALAELCAGQIGQQLAALYRDGGRDPDKDAGDKAALRDELAGMRGDIATVTADLAHWTFGATAATITFDQDAIASHAEGAFSCGVPLARLRTLAKPDAPLPEAAATAN